MEPSCSFETRAVLQHTALLQSVFDFYLMSRIPVFPLRNLRCLSGQSLVEFALTLPLLLLILLGAIDLGRVFNTYVAITNASREGARYGVSNPTDDPNIKTRVKQEAVGSGVTVIDSDIAIQCFTFTGGSNPPSVSCASALKGDLMEVTVAVNFQFMTLYLLRIPNIRVSTWTTMALINGK